MVRIIETPVLISVDDNEVLVEDKTSLKAVVGIYEKEFIALTIVNSEGKKSYLMNKKFAQDLAKAIEEKSK